MDRKATLTLHDRAWSGWVRDAKPVESSVQITAQEGTVLSPETLGGAREAYSSIEFLLYELKVERITAEQVCFTYKRLVITNPGGGINLTAQPSGRFWLWSGRSKELATPTMDGGTIVTITVNSIDGVLVSKAPTHRGRE